MRTTIITGALLFTAGLAACSPDRPAPDVMEPQLSRSAAQCQNLAGTVQADFLDEAQQAALPGYAAGAVIAGTLLDDQGVAIGGAYAWIDDLQPSSPEGGALKISMRHRYAIGGSLLDTRDSGVLAPVAPPHYHFNNKLTVTGGTGAFAGASGFISAHGDVEVGGSIALRYRGRVCT